MLHVTKEERDKHNSERTGTLQSTALASCYPQGFARHLLLQLHLRIRNRYREYTSRLETTSFCPAGSGDVERPYGTSRSTPTSGNLKHLYVHFGFWVFSLHRQPLDGTLSQACTAEPPAPAEANGQPMHSNSSHENFPSLQSCQRPTSSCSPRSSITWYTHKIGIQL